MHVTDIAQCKPSIIINVTYNRDQSVFRWTKGRRTLLQTSTPSHMYGQCRTRRFRNSPGERQMKKVGPGNTFETVTIPSTMPRVRRQDRFQGWRYQSVRMVKDFQRGIFSFSMIRRTSLPLMCRVSDGIRRIYVAFRMSRNHSVFASCLLQDLLRSVHWYLSSGIGSLRALSGLKIVRS